MPDGPVVAATPGVEQAPPGEHPSDDDVPDVAVEYAFPCGDPIPVDSCCAKKV